MSALESALPDGFESLEPFVGTWAVAGTANRAKLRLVSSEADRVAFFDAASVKLQEALAYLDRKPLSAFDDKEERLMNLMLSLCHAGIAVEVQGSDEPFHSLARRHMHITRTPADA